MPASTPDTAGTYAQLDEDFGATSPVNAAATSPMGPAEYLDHARRHIDVAHLRELERLAHAAGELYGDAVRDQLHRAISDVAHKLGFAGADLATARRLYTAELDRLHSAVNQWAADYHTIDDTLAALTDALEAARADALRPNLGCATTRDLIGELVARLDDGNDSTTPHPAAIVTAALQSAASKLSEAILDYRTIDS